MTFNPGVNCCPCCKVPHCLSGDTIDEGCCVGCEDLIMWSERPSYSMNQELFLQPNTNPGSTCLGKPSSFDNLSQGPFNFGGGSIGKIMNYKTYVEELEPVQTLYSFHRTYWKPYGGFNIEIGIPGDGERLLPLIDDPINCEGFASQTGFTLTRDAEAFTGLLARCRYESQADRSVRQMRLGDCASSTRARSCLDIESPCNTQAQAAKKQIASSDCSGQEDGVNCYGFYLTWDVIKEDLSRGYNFPFNIESGGQQWPYTEFFNCCYPSGSSPGSDPCGPPPSILHPICTCGSRWLTNYRKRKLLDDKRYAWAVDVECYDGGDFLIPSVPKALSDYWLFNMTNERWWKIKETTGLDPLNPDRKIPLSFWEHPDGSNGIWPNPTKGIQTTQQDPVGEFCGYSDDKLVPKWWIYGCSGVPIFEFELQDAWSPMSSLATDLSIKRDPVIERANADALMLDLQNGPPVGFYYEYRNQTTFEKMSKGGYFDSKDWREEQRIIYQELAQRFPGAGYEQHLNIDWSTIELGPFRKRFYAPHTLGLITPYLSANKVPDSAKDFQAPINLNYPGRFPGPGMTAQEIEQAINDYYFWAERQWVYFRAVPQGWTWVSWQAYNEGTCFLLDCPETEEGEIQAILAGCGRGSGACIESWFNSPQKSYTVNIGSGSISLPGWFGSCGHPDEHIQECCSGPSSKCIAGDAAACLEGGCREGPMWACEYATACIDAKNTDPDGCCKDGPCIGPCNYEDACPKIAAANIACSACMRNAFQALQTTINYDRCQIQETESACGATPDVDGSPPLDQDGTFGLCGCSPTPFLGCFNVKGSTGNTGESCLSASVNAYCDGVHIMVTQYGYENFFNRTPLMPQCNMIALGQSGLPGPTSSGPLLTPVFNWFNTAKFRPLYQVNTYLTSAKNTREYIQKRCVGSANTGLKGFWPTVTRSHQIFNGICDAHRRSTYFAQPFSGPHKCSKCIGIDSGGIISFPGEEECGWRTTTPDSNQAGTFIPFSGVTPDATDQFYKVLVSEDGGYCFPEIDNRSCQWCRDPDEECSCDDDTTIECTIRRECTPLNHASPWTGRQVCPPTCDLKFNPSACDRDDYLGYKINCTNKPIT